MAETTNLAGRVLEGLESFAKNFQWDGKPILKSNEAINPINTVGRFIMGEENTGIRGTLKGLSEKNSIGDSIKSAYTNENGGLNYKAITGTYIGASLAGRVATGGGLYRDSTGNVNAPGIPFI